MRQFVSALLLGAGFASTSAAQRADSLTRAVDKVFESFNGTNGPGCAVGVSRDGVVVFERGYGMANLETDTPIRPTSIFHVASVSKQFTAAAIMLLEREGKLSVDDNIRKYLPEIPDYSTPITIRHLLTHTSGLRDQWELIGFARGRFEEDRITEADVLDIVPRQTALNFKPGAEYVYSNTGFTLLGVIVKRITGQSLRDFADARIFKPLGMTHTHFHDDYTMLVPGRTSAYEPVSGNGAQWRVGIPNFDTYGATSLYTTVGDLLKWEANLDHPTVGDATMIARMETPTLLTTGDTSYYGFGLAIGNYRGARVIEHGGADAGYRSYVGRFPDKKLGIAITCNAATANTTALAHGVADAFLGGSLTPVEVAATPQGVALAADRLQRYVGVYVQPTTLQVIRLVTRDGRLSIDAPNAPALVPLADNRFAVTGQPGEVTFSATERGGFDRRFGTQRPTHFEWRQAVTPSASVLAPYAGDYVSAELGGATYRVASSDSAITLRTGTEEPFTARLMYADTFVGDGYTIQFTRAGGRVNGFEVTNPRMRGVKFARR
ncbi:MAG TPA: serine hydrolase domain-containing protein [Gemmatimonadaceae bacterium]|jgi:CubicO group peptidase (beta-lactamase class C family)